MANLKFKGVSRTKIDFSTYSVTSSTLYSTSTFTGTAFSAATSTSGVTVMVGDEPSHVRTTNFQTYSKISFGAPGGTQFYGIAWFKDKFIAVGNSNNIYTSDQNGTSWTFVPHAIYGSMTINWKGIAVSSNRVVIVGTNSGGNLVIQSSADGVTWTDVTPWDVYNNIGYQSLTSVADIIIYDGTKFIVIANSGLLLNSVDGVTWTASLGVTARGAGEWLIFYTGNKYVATKAGVLNTSTDGTNWTQISNLFINSTYQNLYKVVCIDTFVYGMSYTSDFFSTDGGATWSTVQSADSNFPTYGNGHRLAYNYAPSKILVYGQDTTGTSVITRLEQVYKYGSDAANTYTNKALSGTSLEARGNYFKLADKFSLEFFIKPTSIPSQQFQFITTTSTTSPYSEINSGQTYGVRAYLNSTGSTAGLLALTNGGFGANGVIPLLLNKWNHVCFCRKGSYDWEAYVNNNSQILNLYLSSGYTSKAAYGEWHYRSYGQGYGTLYPIGNSNYVYMYVNGVLVDQFPDLQGNPFFAHGDLQNQYSLTANANALNFNLNTVAQIANIKCDIYNCDYPAGAATITVPSKNQSINATFTSLIVKENVLGGVVSGSLINTSTSVVPGPFSEVAKNSAMSSGEFDTNLLSLNYNKLENSGYTAGSVLYANNDSTLLSLAIGSTGNILTAGASAVLWQVANKTPVDVQLFSTAGTSTWIKPSGAKLVHVVLIGGGGGGGSGTRISPSYTSTGGTGGGAGGRIEFILNAASVSSTVSVTVGQGGAGGVPDIAQNAYAGSTGGDSLFGMYAAQGGIGGLASYSFGNGNYITRQARGGISQHAFVYDGSRDGRYSLSNSASTNGEMLGYGSFNAASSNPALYTLYTAVGGANGYFGPGGGGGGGGWTGSSATPYLGTHGGLGGIAIANNTADYNIVGSGGTAGSTFGASGTTSTSQAQLDNLLIGGNGGGGGSSSATGSAGNGGDGFRGGGGGGGGVTAFSGASGGRGGTGGTGQVLVITYF